METGRLQIMQTLVGNNESSGLTNISQSPPMMYSVYRQDNNSFTSNVSPLPRASPAASTPGSNAPPMVPQAAPVPLTTDGDQAVFRDGRRSPVSRNPSNISSGIGAAVHRIPRQESFRVLSAGEELMSNETDESRQRGGTSPPQSEQGGISTSGQVNSMG